MMSHEPEFEHENEKLRQAWDRHSREFLDGYLVADVEDPRINQQSILNRALLVDAIWPDRFTDLIEAEMRFGVVMTWLLQAVRQQDPFSLYQRIEEGDCPPVVRETQQALTRPGSGLPDFIQAALLTPRQEQALSGMGLMAFRDLWQAAMAGVGQAEATPSVLEVACGSANDYRWLAAYGIARHVRYSGFDISPKNIANALERHPSARFHVASILDSGIESEAHDYVYAHDLYEHLSPAGLERALAETLRITRREAWLHFFKLVDQPEHEFIPREDYYFNRLSLPRVVATLESLGGQVEVVPIADLIRTKFGHEPYHNPGAVSLIVRKQ